MRVYDPTFLRDILKAANITIEDANLEISPSGIRLASMDPSHETMVSLFIPVEAFEAYDVEVPFTVCFNIKETLTMLFGKGNKSLKKMDLSLVFKEDVIEAEIKKGSLKTVKTIRLLEPLEEETPEPRISYKAKADMTLKALKQVIEDCTVNELFTVKADYEGIRFTCTDGEDWLEENYLEKDAEELLRLTVEGTQQANYRVKHFKGFMKGLRPLSELVTLEYSDEYPMKLTAWLNWVNAQLVYYSAPRIIEEPQVEEVPVEEPQIIEPQAIEAPVEAKTRYHFYMDPGHGWLKVPIKDLVTLGIAGKISAYSYVYGENAYLEEYCDAPIFLKALKERNQDPRIEEHTANGSSRIRGYPPYRPEDYREEPQAIEDLEDFEGLDLSPEERQALTTMYDNYMIDVFGKEDQLTPEQREQLINQDLAAEIFPEGTPEEEDITEEPPLKGDYQARCAAACAAVDEIYRQFAEGS